MNRWLSDSALERLRAAADAPDLEGSRYRMVGKLGQGGMAGVFRVVDVPLQREVALKVITAGDPGDDWSRRLLQEARVIASLEHPGIVPVYDAGLLADGRAFYAMKLVHGKRLQEHTQALPKLADRLRVFLRICDAVAFAHARGVLHRDLKPSNIMVGPFGEVLVMDWGLARMVAESPDHAMSPSSPSPGEAENTQATGTAHGTVFGTPGFRAPEQAQGLPSLDQRADVYSLGAILQFLLTGASPQPTPRQLAAIQRQALAPDREHRYQSVAALSTDVACFLDGLAVSAYPEGPLAPARRWMVRNRVWILLLLAYVLTRALLIIFRSR